MLYSSSGQRHELKLVSNEKFTALLAGVLAISKNLSLEGAPFQAFVMERVLIVSDF